MTIATDSNCGVDPSRGAEVYRHALAKAGGRELQALRRTDNRSPVCAAMYSSPPYALSVPPLLVPRIAVNLTAAPVRGGIDGDRPRDFFARRYSLFLTPPGESVTWRKDSPSTHLGIYFEPEFFNGAGDDAPLLAVASTIFNAVIPGIGTLIDQFAEELQTPGILNVEAADSLARLLLIRLARYLHRKAALPHALTPKVIARLHDYVAHHMSERILVADLAKQTGLSPNHFALSFTEHTGLSPHKFVLKLRVNHAAELLVRSELSLADISHDCGFASQQHMNNAFRRHLHTTPGQYRALRLAAQPGR
jgi:AraC family transcriptional regulator